MDAEDSEEQQLVAQYQQGTVSRGQCHSMALEFLLRPENSSHWWCQHCDLTKEMSEVLVYQGQPGSQQFWQHMSQQLAICSSCINRYHSAQIEFLLGQYEPEPVLSLLKVLFDLDKQRLLGWLSSLQQDGAAPDDSQITLALYELLGWCHYMEDQELCNALVSALDKLDWKLQFGEGDRFPGFYKLLAHPSAAVRSKAMAFARDVGMFSLEALANCSLVDVLDTWVDTLQQRQPQAAGANHQQLRVSVKMCDLVDPTARQQWQVVHVWLAWKTLFGLFEAECMQAILQNYPVLPALIVQQACPAAVSQQPQLAGQQATAHEGSMEQKHALGCLHLLFKSLKQRIWWHINMPAESIVHQLQATCWAAVARQNTATQKLLVQVLQAVIESLLPQLWSSPVQDASDVEDSTPAAALVLTHGTGSWRQTCKQAAELCLRLLLVQLPGSVQVPLLIRGLALEAGLACCSAAMQSPGCHGSAAALCHLWGPVAAQLLLVPDQQYRLPQGQALLQHRQIPGLVQLAPVLAQMQNLQATIVDAAAELVALTLQVDTAVLRAVLSDRSTAGCKSRLLPAALDVIEVAISNKAEYTCCPGLWRALEGCGHSLVSATYAAVAAELAPLAATANAALAELQLPPATEQFLQGSLQLSDPETIELCDSRHAVPAEKYAGWLHKQCVVATVRHLHTCSRRESFFLLKPTQQSPRLKSPSGTQPTINTYYQQICSGLPADRNAAGPYAVVVCSVCSLLLLGGTGHAAALVVAAEQALLSSCSLAVGQLQQAVQDHLLTPGCAVGPLVIEVLHEELRDLQKHRAQQVILQSPERLSALLQLTQYVLLAAIKHGLDAMLPVLAAYLPAAWQLITDHLSGCSKLLAAMSPGCNSLHSQDGTTTAGQPHQQQHGGHIGRPATIVLKALLEGLPTAWQCYYVLLHQRHEQRQLYTVSLGSQDATPDHMLTPTSAAYLCSQGGSQCGSQANGNNADRTFVAELQQVIKWMVHLLTAGKQLYSSQHGWQAGCIASTTGAHQLQQAWKAALQGVVKVTNVPLPRAVRAAAAELFSLEAPILDKAWLAELLPSAAPGGLAKPTLGNWPTLLGGGNIFAAVPYAAMNALANGAAPAAAAGAGCGIAAAEMGPAATGVGPAAAGTAMDDLIDLTADDEDWVGEWQSSDDVEIVSEGGSDQCSRQASDAHDASEDAESVQQQQPRQSWPWLHQQPQQQQQGAPQAVDGSGSQYNKSTSKMLPSSKVLSQPAGWPVGDSSFYEVGEPAVHASTDVFRGLLDNLSSAVTKSIAKPAATGMKGNDNYGTSKPTDSKHPSKASTGGGTPSTGHLLSFNRQASNQQNVRQPQQQQKWSMQSETAQQTAQQWQQQQQDVPNLDSCWPSDWSVADGAYDNDASGGRGWHVGKFNHNSSSAAKARQRRAADFAGLSKTDQLRAELLGRAHGAAASNRSGAARGTAVQRALAAQAAADVANYARQTGQAPAATAAAPGRGLNASGARESALAALRADKKQQTSGSKQQQQPLMQQEQQQQPGVLTAPAATSTDARAPQPREARAGIKLLSEDALFQQAATASAAANTKPNKLAAAFPGATVRHSSVLTLSGPTKWFQVLRAGKSGLLPRRGLGAGALGGQGPPALKQYPPLNMADVIADILKWGYPGANSGRSRQGESTAAAPKKLLLKNGEVPLAFESRGHYCNVFKGLLLEELRAGLASAHQELMSVGGNASGRAGAGSFKCMQFMIDSVQRVDNNVLSVTAWVNTSSLPDWDRESPRVEDYIVVTKVQLASAAELAPDKLPRSHLAALVRDAASSNIRGYRLVTLWVCPSSSGSQLMTDHWKQLLISQMQLWLTVVTSLVPSFREFQALCAVQDAPATDQLLRQVLAPKPPGSEPLSNLVPVNPNTSARANGQSEACVPAGLRNALAAAYNLSQQAAVAASLDQRWPFVLVQGPPGTGKTSAIMGILSAQLAAKDNDSQRPANRCQKQQQQEANVAGQSTHANAAKAHAKTADASISSNGKGSLPQGAALSAIQFGVTPPVRVLVCAQSNAAIDELITRLADEGVWSETGAKRAAAMVRLGRSDATHPSVLMFHVDALAEGQMKFQQQQQLPVNDLKAGLSGQLNPAQEKLRDLRQQLQQVEKDLAHQDAAAAAGQRKTAAQPTGSSTAAGGHVGQQQRALNKQMHAGSKRSRDTAAAQQPPAHSAVGEAAAGSAEHGSAAAAPVDSSRRAAAAANGSSSDMDISDNDAATAGQGLRQQQQHCQHHRGTVAAGDTAAWQEDKRHRASRHSDRQVDRHEHQPSNRHVGLTEQRDSERSHSREQHEPHQERTGRDPSREKGEHQGHECSSDRGRQAYRQRSDSRDKQADRPGRPNTWLNRQNECDRSRQPSDRHRHKSSRDSKGHRKRHRSKSRDHSNSNPSVGHDRKHRRHSSSKSRSRSSSSRDKKRRKADDRQQQEGGKQTGGSTALQQSKGHGGRSSGQAQGQLVEQSKAALATEHGGRDHQCQAQPDHNKQQCEQQQVVADDRHQRVAVSDNAEIRASVLRDQQRSLLAALRQAELQAQRGTAAAEGGRELERAKRSARQAVIKSAEIVLCTLSAAGGDLLGCWPAGAAPLFDVLVVDEAAQALEPATLIPLQMLKPNTGRVVLVGDPCQLPPTVKSKAADAALLSQSLFERLARAGWPVTLLREQYRMHPAISRFPSKHFYEGQLIDGAGITAATKGAPFHTHPATGPFIVWDCQEGRERSGGARGAAGGGSLRNTAEAEFAALLVSSVVNRYKSDLGRIAVISPYRAQVQALRDEFRREFGGQAAVTAANIEFGTVDGFQGREADIVVFSCVRAQPDAAAEAAITLAAAAWPAGNTAEPGTQVTPAAGAPQIGFLADVRRMNVGLTRGRRAVWVVCHAATLAASPAWRPLLEEAHARCVLLEARQPIRRLLQTKLTNKQLRGCYWTAAAETAAAATAKQPPVVAAGAGSAVPDAAGQVVDADAAGQHAASFAASTSAQQPVNQVKKSVQCRLVSSKAAGHLRTGADQAQDGGGAAAAATGRKAAVSQQAFAAVPEVVDGQHLQHQSKQLAKPPPRQHPSRLHRKPNLPATAVTAIAPEAVSSTARANAHGIQGQQPPAHKKGLFPAAVQPTAALAEAKRPDAAGTESAKAPPAPLLKPPQAEAAPRAAAGGACPGEAKRAVQRLLEAHGTTEAASEQQGKAVEASAGDAASRPSAFLRALGAAGRATAGDHVARSQMASMQQHTQQTQQQQKLQPGPKQSRQMYPVQPSHQSAGNLVRGGTAGGRGGVAAKPTVARSAKPSGGTSAASSDAELKAALLRRLEAQRRAGKHV